MEFVLPRLRIGGLPKKTPKRHWRDLKGIYYMYDHVCHLCLSMHDMTSTMFFSFFIGSAICQVVTLESSSRKRNFQKPLMILYIFFLKKQTCKYIIVLYIYIYKLVLLVNSMCSPRSFEKQPTNLPWTSSCHSFARPPRVSAPRRSSFGAGRMVCRGSHCRSVGPTEFGKPKSRYITVLSKGTPTYPWSIPHTSPNPQMKGISS